MDKDVDGRDTYLDESAGTNRPKWWTRQLGDAWEEIKDTFRSNEDEDDETDADMRDDGTDTRGAALPRRAPSTDFASAEPALRYGFGAAAFYKQHEDWDEDLEGALRNEWQALGNDNWTDAMTDIRRGWELGRRT